MSKLSKIITDKTRKHIAYCLFFLLFFLSTLAGLAQAAEIPWTEETTAERAAALDAARGWSEDCPPAQEETQLKPQGANPQISGQAYTKFLIRENIMTASGLLIGAGETNCPQEKLNFIKNSAVGKTANLIDTIYSNPPASSVYYAYDVLQNAGFAPKVHAQGVGFSALQPILPIWKAFRNLAYAVLILVFIVLGLMIMLRIHIDPQTVVTIQNTLPKIAVTLILITFSYAIAGLLIDFMYLAILVIIGIFGTTGLVPSDSISDLQQQYTTGGLGVIIKAVFGGGIGAGWQILKEGLNPLANLGGIIGGGAVAGVLVSMLPFIGIGATTAAIGGGILVTLLFAILLLFIFFRIFFMLLTAYINIIVGIVFGPLQILIGAFPGQQGFSSWLRSITANLVVFPITAALLIMTTVLTNTANSGTLWSPPLVIFSSSEAVLGIISLGVLLITPKAADIARELIKAEPPKYTAVPGAAIGAVFGAPIGFVSQATQTAIAKSIYEKPQSSPSSS